MIFVSFAEPESALDWLNFWVALATALGTLAAVVFAVLSARASLRDARKARGEAAASAKRLEEDQKAARELAGRQANAAEKLTETHRELERERRQFARRDELERKAVHQATGLSHRTRYMSGGFVLADGVDAVAERYVVVSNPSDGPISDILIQLEGGQPPAEAPSQDSSVRIVAGKSQPFLRCSMAIQADDPRVQLRVTIEFTDDVGNRWRLNPDNSLVLLNPRSISEVDVK